MRHLYTKWEENPEEAIEMSKHRLSFSCASLGHFRFSSSSICDTGSPIDTVNTDNDNRTGMDASDTKAGSDSAFIEVQEEEEDPSVHETNNCEGDSEEREESTIEVFQTDSSDTKLEELSTDKATSDSKSNGITTATATRVEIGDECSDIQQSLSKSDKAKLVDSNTNEAAEVTSSSELPEDACDDVKTSQNESIQEKEDDGEIDEEPERKVSAAELLLKQARVRESLQMQGVVRNSYNMHVYI